MILNKINYKRNKQKMNIDFWSFIHLITAYPELYLSNEGKIINKIATSNGKCQNLSKLSRYVGIKSNLLGEICKKIQNQEHITIIKDGNCKSIVFNKKIKEEGKKIIENMLGK